MSNINNIVKLLEEYKESLRKYDEHLDEWLGQLQDLSLQLAQLRGKLEVLAAMYKDLKEA